MGVYSIKKQIPWKVNLLSYWRTYLNNDKGIDKTNKRIKLVEWLIFIHSVVDSDGKEVDSNCIDYIKCLTFEKNGAAYAKTKNKYSFFSNSKLFINGRYYYNDEFNTLGKLNYKNGVYYISDNSKQIYSPISEFKINTVFNSDNSDIKTDNQIYFYNTISPALHKNNIYNDAGIRNNLLIEEFYDNKIYNDEANSKEINKRNYFYDEDIINTDSLNKDYPFLIFEIVFKKDSGRKIQFVYGDKDNNVNYTELKTGTGDNEVLSMIAVASNPFILPSFIFKNNVLKDNPKWSIDTSKIKKDDSLLSFRIDKSSIRKSIIAHAPLTDSRYAIFSNQINNDYYNIVYSCERMSCIKNGSEDDGMDENIDGCYGYNGLFTNIDLNNGTNPTKNINLNKYNYGKKTEIDETNIRNCCLENIKKVTVSSPSNYYVDKDHLQTIENENKSYQLSFKPMSNLAKNYIKPSSCIDYSHDKVERPQDKFYPDSNSDRTKDYSFDYSTTDINEKMNFNKNYHTKEFGSYFVGMMRDGKKKGFTLNTNTIMWDAGSPYNDSKNGHQFFSQKDDNYVISGKEPCILFHGMFEVNIVTN